MFPSWCTSNVRLTLSHRRMGNPMGRKEGNRHYVKHCLQSGPVSALLSRMPRREGECKPWGGAAPQEKVWEDSGGTEPKGNGKWAQDTTEQRHGQRRQQVWSKECDKEGRTKLII